MEMEREWYYMEDVGRGTAVAGITGCVAPTAGQGSRDASPQQVVG